jgi:hypothetical protein
MYRLQYPLFTDLAKVVFRVLVQYVLYQIDLVLHVIFFVAPTTCMWEIDPLFYLYFTETIFLLFFSLFSTFFARNDKGGRLYFEPSRDPHAKGLLWVTIYWFVFPSFQISWLIFIYICVNVIDTYGYTKNMGQLLGWMEY